MTNGQFSQSRLLLPAAVVAVVVLTALFSMQGSEPRPALGKGAAVAAASSDPSIRSAVRGHANPKVTISRIDDELTRVTFEDDGRTLAEAAVSKNGDVRDAQSYAHGVVIYGGGSTLANSPLLWLVAGLMFVVATIGDRLLQIRTLDIFATLGVMASVALYNGAFITSSSLVGYPILLYLALRCGWLGLRTTSSAQHSTVPLERGSARPQLWRRFGWPLVGAALTINVLVAAAPSVAVDVGYASMAGATALLDGMVPYGNLTSDIIHGDTYPPLAYLLYVPAEVLWPVRDIFDAPTGALVMSALGTCMATAFLARARGPRIALAFAVHPIVLIGSASGSNDMLIPALLAAAILTIQHPGRSTALVATAAWVKVAPVIIIPLWLACCRGRSRLLALLAIAAASLVALVPLLAVGGTSAITAMVEGISFQATRGTLKSLWAHLHLPVAQHGAEAIAIVAALTLAIWLERRTRTGLSLQPERLCALAAALLLTEQIAARHWTPLYFVWALPFLLVALFSGESMRKTPHLRVDDTAPEVVR